MNTFSELGLNAQLLKAIAGLGFETPTPVQEQVIPALLGGQQDCIALAQTGTGKTAAYGLPLLHLIDTTGRELQGLILCPTRELCVQVATDLERYSQYMPSCRITAVYGGASIVKQITELRAGAHIIVATPGRLMDLMERGVVKSQTVTRVILDEADEMLNMGFQEDIETIMSAMTARQSVWLFSATMPNEVRRIASTYMTNPREITLGTRNMGAKNIEHHYYLCKQHDRFQVLKRIVDYYPGIYGVIFCRTKAETQEIAEQMMRDGYSSGALHGDLSQAERDKTMKRFRERSLQLLIATDVAARGIDVSDLTHVINYSLPDEIEIYTHRSGRTARAGKSGISVSIVTPKEQHKIRVVERITGATFKQMHIPSGVEVCEKQMMHIVQGIHDTEIMHAEIEPYLPAVYEALQDLSKEDLIKRLAAVEFNRFLQYYRDAPDLNPRSEKRGEFRDTRDSRDGRGVSGGAGNWVRLFINVGEMDGIEKKQFIKLIRAAGLPAERVGKIDVGRSFSFFEVNASDVRMVRDGLSEMTVNHHDIVVQEATDRDNGGPSKKKFKDKAPFWEKKRA